MSDNTAETQYNGGSPCPRCGARRWPGEYCPSCGLAPEASPRPPRRSGMRSATAALGTAFVVLVIAVVAAVWTLRAHTSSATGSSSTHGVIASGQSSTTGTHSSTSKTGSATGSAAGSSTGAANPAGAAGRSASSTATGGPLPQISVDVNGVTLTGSSGSPARALQRFANDVAAGSTGTIISHCWTFAPQRWRATMTFAGRQAILAALSQQAEGVQTGYLWKADGVSVAASWQELGSPYACPVNTGQGMPSYPQAYDARYLLYREAARLKGSPIQPSDTAANYALICSYVQIPQGNQLNYNSEPDRQFLPAAAQQAITQLAADPNPTISSGSSGGLLVQPAGASTPQVDVIALGDPCIFYINPAG